MRVGGRPDVVAGWQNTGGSSQMFPGFDSRLLPDFSLSSLFVSQHLSSFISSLRQDVSSRHTVVHVLLHELESCQRGG